MPTDTQPVSIRLDKQVIENLKRVARYESFKRDQDVTYATSSVRLSSTPIPCRRTRMQTPTKTIAHSVYTLNDHIVMSIENQRSKPA